MKKVFYFILILTLSSNLHAQDQSKLGLIVFESCKYMANKHLMPSAKEIEQKKENFKKFVERNIDSKKPDEFINSIPKTEIQVYGDSLKCIYTLDIYKDIYESKVSCKYLKKSDAEMYKQIDRKSLEASTVKRNITTNSYTIFPKRKLDQFSISDTYKITEYRNDVRTILGYKCFKIILEKKSFKNPHLDVYNIEMFVTEDIRLNYSPITQFKDVLDKYYPLEIAKKPKKESMVEVIVWKVKEIDLKNM